MPLRVSEECLGNEVVLSLFVLDLLQAAVADLVDAGIRVSHQDR